VVSVAFLVVDLIFLIPDLLTAAGSGVLVLFLCHEQLHLQKVQFSSSLQYISDSVWH
jgi:hypothetical protein